MVRDVLCVWALADECADEWEIGTGRTAGEDNGSGASDYCRRRECNKLHNFHFAPLRIVGNHAPIAMLRTLRRINAGGNGTPA